MAHHGLQDMLGALDDEPYVDPGQIDWFDAFDFGDDDVLGNLIEAGDLPTDDLEDFGGADMIEILDAFVMDDLNEERIGETIQAYKHHDRVGIPAGRRTLEQMPIYTRLDIHRDLRLYTTMDTTEVLLSDGDRDLVVGKSTQHVAFSIPIAMHQYYDMANMFAEEVGGTGTNMGFSAFFHNATTMMLAHNTVGVVEPLDGGDYATLGISFEITGRNWLVRETRCQVVLSKYLINNAILYALPFHEEYNLWSWNEDNRIITSFYGTAFDYEQTPRSLVVEQIARRIPLITREQRRALGLAYLAYQSERPVINSETIAPNIDYTTAAVEIEQCILAGSKYNNGNSFVPSPFRVLYPQEEPDVLPFEMVKERQGVQIFTTDYTFSTYHTWDTNRDPQDVLESTCPRFPEHAVRSAVSVQHSLYFRALSYKSFAHAYIQSNLLPKITGKGGCYYDEYCRAGIAWFRHNKDSLTWNCCYYMFSHPGDPSEVGIWSYIETKNCYVGPNFKVNRQDIHYASVLPAKIHAMMAAARPLLSPIDLGMLEPRLFSLLGGLSNSSWMTSFRSGANRFITCCHMSGSGDIPALIRGQLGRERFHRFSDFYLMTKMRNYCRHQGPRDTTPFWQLPFALCSLEKDYSQMMQWHMRTTNHDTQCMVKVSEAAQRHAAEYEATVRFMSMQCESLDLMMARGLSYIEFKRILDETPAFPVFNVFTFLAMCNLASEEIRTLGASQHAMGFTIWKMMTDRHCTKFCYDPVTRRPILTSSRVVDALSGYLRQRGSLHGPYELIAKMSAGDPLPPNYLLNHAKDAKESDREISQQFPEHRIKQCFPEVLVETFTGATETDQMADSTKYEKHVNDTMEICRIGRAVHASEDRSKFCQEQEPQMQALGLACIALQGRSTALSSAAAMTLMNKTRRIVYPPKADIGQLLGDLPREIVTVNHNRRSEFAACITIEKNMTQGLGAITAGAINTIYVAAQDNIVSKISPGIVQGARRTTSDDVKRSANVAPGYDYVQQSAIFYKAPNLDLHKTMMVDNIKKPIFSSRFSEFNNVIASRTGMVPQSPIYATLAVQPLLSKSLFGDLVDMVSSARSTISWGCPPDVAEAALYGMRRAFKQKWLVTDHEERTLYNAGLLPRNMSQQISGYWVRNENTLRLIYSMFTDEQRRAILRGEVPLYKMLKRIEIDLGVRRRKKRTEHVPIPGLHRANAIAESIYSQRLSSESLLSRHITPIAHSERRRRKDQFFELINLPTPDIDITRLQSLAPPKVMIHTRPARRKDRKPTSLGTTGLIPTSSLQRIRARRHLNVNYRDYPTDEENNIAIMEDEDFLHQVAIMERTTHYQGLSFKAPAGRPLTRVFDGVFYTRPAVFDFTVDLVQLPNATRPFTYKGIRVEAFRPIIWGSSSLMRIRTGKYEHIAFGHGFMDHQKVIFYKYQTRGAELSMAIVDPNTVDIGSVRNGGHTIYYRLTPDSSALLIQHHGSTNQAYMPGVVGDNNAVLNYGMYCRSNSNQGFEIYREMFKRYKSVIPYFVQKSMPPYPTFARHPVEIPQAKLTVLQGYQCILQLKLTVQENPERTVTIDLNGRRPEVHGQLLLNEDDDMAWR